MTQPCAVRVEHRDDVASGGLTGLDQRLAETEKGSR